MDVKRTTTGWWLAAVALVALFGVAVGSPGDAVAQAAKKYRQQLDQYSSRLDKLAERDEWGVSADDRARAGEWLENAKVLLAEGDTDSAAMLLRQADDMLTLIEAEIRAKRIEALADEQEDKYFKLKDEVLTKLQSEIDQLRQEKEQLQREFEQLK